MFTILRSDTPNYSFVVSQHATFKAAESALDSKCAAISRKSPLARPYDMYWISDQVEPKTKSGTRVRQDRG